MGRFPASGARLHEPRQPKPANAAFRQGRPLRSPRLLVRSRASPTRHPASLPGKARPWALSGGLPCPQRSGGRTPPRRPRGALPASSPWDLTGRMPAQAPWGCCPGRALAGLRESGAPRRVPGISAGKPSKEALHRRPIGGTQAKAPRRLCEGNRTHVGRSRRACHTPAAALVQKAPKTALGRAAAPTQVYRAQCGTGKALQESRRRCTRTPRRRRRSGWTGRLGLPSCPRSL